MVSKRSGRKIGRCVPLETHKALIFRKENGDASINFADSERDEHVGLRGKLMAVRSTLQHVRLESGTTLGLSGTSVDLELASTGNDKQLV